MNKKYVALWALSLSFLCGGIANANPTTYMASGLAVSAHINSTTNENGNLNVIPQPQHVKEGKGNFTINNQVVIAAANDAALQEAEKFADAFEKLYGVSLDVKKQKKGSITFSIDKKVKGTEAYTLTITEKGITAKASTTAGLFYAAQTLLQLPSMADAGKGKVEMPIVNIKDSPRFAYRGVMLDPCRHFLPVEAVKKQIDVLSTYKINRIHWHLTDDQGWRIEIKKYPELLKYGAKRTEGDGSPYSGYYTQQQVKDVVAYAKQHHIEIVPELEMPGHGMAAIAAFPWLSCSGETTTPRIIWGVEDVVFCPGKETTFRFLEDVIDEMVPLFPGKLFHIGGDESPRGEWEKCDSCQARMKHLGYTKTAQLQSYVVERIGKYLAKKGKQLIGWDEILEGGGLSKNAVIMSWRGEQGGISAAKAGHPVLMTPSSTGFYFDTYQGDYMTEHVAIGGYSTLKRVYSYDPVPKAIYGTGKENLVLGIQANCWSEYIHTPEVLEYRLYPRALALAEVGWSQLNVKNFEDFRRRVDGDASIRLKKMDVNYHIPLPEQPGGSVSHLAFTDTTSLTLNTTRPVAKIVYTLDGTEPTSSSYVYNSPIKFDKTTVVKTASVLPSGIMSPSRTIFVEKQRLLPSSELKNGKPGLTIKVWKGNFFYPENLDVMPADTTFHVDRIEALRKQAKVPNSVRNVKNYAAVVDGYFQVDKDGVYEFSSNNNQVWIDGKLIVDNSREDVPRYSPNNSEIALGKGYHKIKVSFLGGIFGGWPTYWDDASVSIRAKAGKWGKITPEMLKTE